MNDASRIAQLRRMISTPDDCAGCGCVLDDDRLAMLLDRYDDLNAAAYHACVMLSQETELHLPDGTALPSQSKYWLRLALRYRRNLGRSLHRADEVTA